MEKLFVGDGEVKVEGDVIDLETRLSVIQALIPLGLEAVADLLQEVEQLAGVRYARKGSEQAHRRWGSQKGSVYLMDQKLPLDVPRVRDVEADAEVPLAGASSTWETTRGTSHRASMSSSAQRSVCGRSTTSAPHPTCST